MEALEGKYTIGSSENSFLMVSYVQREMLSCEHFT
jgi:hypothetical protein